MGKQKYIKSLEEAFERTKGEMSKTNMGTVEHYILTGTLDGISNAFNLTTQLEESKAKKPVVPQFVADWYEENQYNLENGIFQLCIDSAKGDLERDFKDWFNDSHAIETLINMQYGYSVEEEPKWVIKCPTGYVERLDFHNDYTGGNSAKEYTRKTVSPSMEMAIRFTDKDKAETLASILDGEVEDWIK